MKLKLAHTLLLFFYFTFWAKGQIITTIAGSIGVAGYSGNSGPAVSALLRNPVGIAADAAGTIYFTDQNNYVVRKIDNGGIITTVAGNGTIGYSGDGGNALLARFMSPVAVAVDNSGNLFIVDAIAQVVRKVDASGIITTYAGNGTQGYSGDVGPAKQAQLSNPAGVAVDNSGNVYISDAGNHVVRKVNTADFIGTFAGNGSLGYTGDGGAPSFGQLGTPAGIAADNAGNIYVADSYFSVIRRIDASGIISTFAGNGTAGYGGDGALAVSAQFQSASPQGLAVDNLGNVWVSDFGNFVIRRIGPNGIIRTIAGNGTSGYSGDGGPAIAAQLRNVYGIAADNSGDIFITDVLDHTIRKIFTCQDLVIAAQPRDSVLCAGGNSGFSVSVTGAAGYQWQVNTGSGWNNISDGTLYTGTATATLGITQGDVSLNGYQYRCQAGNPCSSLISLPASLTVVPAVADAVSIGASATAACEGAPITFTTTPTGGGSSPGYQWMVNGKSVGSGNPVFVTGSLVEGDVVSCLLTSSLACAAPTRSNDIPVTIYPNPVVILPPDTAVFFGSSVVLDPLITGSIVDYQWTPALGLSDPTIADPVANPKDSITYHLSVTSADGCVGGGKITLLLLRKLQIPNAFTPNGDGKNDVFRIPPQVPLVLVDFSVYDRWGSLVFKTSNIGKGWDGTFGGKPAEAGAYVYIIQGTFLGAPVLEKGTVMLVR